MQEGRNEIRVLAGMIANCILSFTITTKVEISTVRYSVEIWDAILKSAGHRVSNRLE